MIFEIYEIPKNITKEEEFMYNLIEKMHWTGLDDGCVLGEIDRLIDTLEQNNASDEIIKEVKNIYKITNSQLGKYEDVLKFIRDRWEELGKPLSLEAHQLQAEKVRKRNEAKIDW